MNPKDMRNEDRIMEAQDIAQEMDRGDEVIEPILWEDDEMMVKLEQELTFGHLEFLKLWWELMLDSGLPPHRVSDYLHAMKMLTLYSCDTGDDLSFLKNLASDQSEIYSRKI